MIKDKPKKKFHYNRPSPEAMKRQANQSSGVYDQIFKGNAQVFSPKKGQSYCVRIMPATWEACEHFGFEIMLHSQIGADNQRYLCLKHHKDEGCPCCEEETELKRSGDGDAAYSIKAKRNYVYWVIDRDKEAEGPFLWRVGWQVDRNIVGICVDKRTNATTFIDDPEEGYDIEFDCVPKNKWSEITNVRIARNSTPLSDSEKRQDKWLNYIQENPIPDMLNFFDADHISKVLSGKKVKEDDEEEDDSEEVKTRSDRKRKKDNEDEEEDEEETDEKPRRRSLRDEDEEEEGEADDEDLDVPKKRRRMADDEEDDDSDEPPKKKKRPVDDEDEDEEDSKPRRKRPDDEEDEDEEDSKPRRKRPDDDDD